MDNEGPPLESLLHRIAETPEDFLAPPRIGQSGKIAVPAVVHDLLELLGTPSAPDELSAFESTDSKDNNRLSVTLLLCWLLADDWFAGARLAGPRALELLIASATELARQAPSPRYVSDPDRREEVARLVLAHFNYRPAGETKAQAQDRLTSLSSVERERVLRASSAAEKRARAIREALARKAAEESADKFTRE
jgi:hypothetical protein